MQTSLHSLHRRLDRLGTNEGPSIAEALEQAQRAHEARQAAWSAAGHPGAPPHKQLPAPPSPNASHAERELWRKIAQGSARVIYGKDPESSPFASMQAIYTMTDNVLSGGDQQPPALCRLAGVRQQARRRHAGRPTVKPRKPETVKLSVERASFPLVRSRDRMPSETLGGYLMAKQSSSSTRHRERSQTIRQGVDVVTGFLTEEVLLAIQEAAADPDTWNEARTDLHKFLASKRVTIPRGLSLSVLEAAPPQTRVAPPGLEHLFPMPPVACPPGMVPTLVTTTVKVCRNPVQVKYTIHDFMTGEDYVIFQMVWCAAWETREEERWYCGWPPMKPALSP
jgi:hypothetical protein